MLGNIASDLDTLLTDLSLSGQVNINKEDLTCKRGTIRSAADTLGKDSFFSSTGDTSRRQGDAISSNHSLISSSDNDRDCDSVDSGHDGRCRSGPSPLVFDPHHFASQPNQCSSPVTSRAEISASMDELRPISTVERLIKTNSIWLLATMSRAGAVHILKDKGTGIFIVRKSSQPNSLALSVQSRLTDHSTVDHYLIEGTNLGFRLQGSGHFFHSVPALIAYYVENIDEIPYLLRLPSAIQQARSTRELASLDMLGQDFWVSPLSRKSPSPEPTRILHKSCSEPINIQRPVNFVATAGEQSSHNTAPSKSASDFSHFMKTQLEMEQYFKQHLHDFPNGGHATDNLSSGLNSKSDFEFDNNLVLFKSQANQTPPPSTGTATTAVQTVSQSYAFDSKEITESSLVNGSSVATNFASSHFNMNAQHFTRLASQGSWVLASSPIDQQQNKMFNAQDVNVYKSNPSNQPAVMQSANCSLQQHLKNSDSSLTHSVQESPPLAFKSTHPLQDGVLKERSWTHPLSVPKNRSNLYFTTNLELLDIPENSYFTSNLSDKLSDYEDIWRNSCCESDIDRKNTMMIHDPRAILDAKVNSHNKKKVSEGKRKVLRKTSKDSPPVRRPISTSRDAVTGGTTGLTALEQARMIAGSTSEDESSVPVAHVRGIKRMENMFEEELVSLDMSTNTANIAQPESFTSERHLGSIQIPTNSTAHQIKFVTTHSLDFNPKCDVECLPLEITSKVPSSSLVLPQKEPSSKCVFTTTMSVIVSESAVSEHSSDTNDKKMKQKPLGHLSRMKSSSESSLATVSSPLYAEPADAVKLRDKNGKAINIQVRRRSAPLASDLKILDNKTCKDQTKVSQRPPLETILSPDAETTDNNNSEPKFLFYPPSSKILTHSPKTNVSISRSQSMRTTGEISRLQSKQNWKDRLGRLKLGTKVLTNNLSPPTVPSFRKNLTTTLDLDSAVFNTSSLAQTSAALSRSFPGKFPVDRRHEANRTSCFSESSTVQDLISCAHPELSVRPVNVKFMKPNDKTEATPPSEYDNLLVYRASTHSSLGTVYSPPWEISTTNKLIRESPTPAAHVLPPAMDIIERIERWQQASSTYHGVGIVDNTVTISDKSDSGQLQESGHSQQNIRWQQQQQLLDHQHQIRNEGSNKVQLCGSTAWQRNKDTTITNYLQQEKDQNELHKIADSGTNSKPVSPPSSPQTTNIGSNTTNSGALSTPHRLSSQCPDVVNCHNTSANQNISIENEMNQVGSGYKKKSNADLLDKNLTEGKPAQAPQISGSQSEWKTPGTKIREYIFKLSGDKQTIFGSTIENFIQCTMESQETNPQYVMRNVRQFMTGIKNYLVKHGEGELENLIERERSKLGANEILNIDAIIEQALHVCVLKPLKYHIYRLFVDKYSRNGALEQLSKNIKYARTKSAQDIGVKPGLKLPQNMDMEVIRHYLELMQKSYSPLQKLQNLLNAISTIYHSVQGNHPSRSSSLGAEDFLPLLIYVIIHCGLVSAEIEADFMWGLLQPSLLTGEGGYYLTTLSSAVLILKNFQETHQLAPAQIEGQLPALSDMQGFLKIAIPDELHGSITWKTLPVRPNMNTKDVCAMVAHKFRITNPQDYGLYLLCDGLESHMADLDCPQIIKGDNLAMGKTCYFAFKRLDANIVWPKHMKNCSHK